MRWDPVHDGRSAFLMCMRALCSPGTPIELPPLPRLTERTELDGAAAILLALLDCGLSLGVSGGAAAQRAAAMVADATGAIHDDVAGADWVLVDGPAAEAISRARRGTALAPERGATLVIAATGEPSPVTLVGPGVCGTARAVVTLDGAALRAFTAANAAPPRGVDLLVVTPQCLIGLPRSVSVGAP